MDIPVTLVINDRVINDVIIINSAFQFQTIRGNSESIRDIVSILNAVEFDTTLYLEHADLSKELQHKYSKFNLSYDFSSSNIKVYYTTNNETIKNSDSMFMVKSYLSGSQSYNKQSGTSSNVNLSSDLGFGLSETSYLEGKLNYRTDDELKFSRLSYRKQLDGNSISLDYSTNKGDEFAKYELKNSTGVTLSNRSDKNTNDERNSITIYENSELGGVVNIFNVDKELVKTVALDRGINKITINRGEVGSDKVTVEVVESGEIIKSTDYFIGGGGRTDTYEYDFTLGSVTNREGEHDIYLSYQAAYGRVSYKGLVVDNDDNYFYTSLGYKLTDTWSLNTKYYYDAKKRSQTEFGISGSHNVNGYLIVGSLYSRNNTRSNVSINSYVQRTFFDKYNATMNYQSSVSEQEYSDGHIDHNRMRNRITSNLNVGLNSNYASRKFLVNWSVNGGYNFERSESFLGINTSFRPKDGSKLLKPNVRLSNNNGDTRLNLSNQFDFDDDRVSFTPEIEFGNNGIGHGANMRADYDKVRGDAFYRANRSNTNVGINLSNTFYMINDDIYSSSSSGDAVVFIPEKNKLADSITVSGKNIGTKEIAVVQSRQKVEINNVERNVNDMDDVTVEIGKYRYIQLDIRETKNDFYLVQGRIVDSNEVSIEEAKVYNHIDETISDERGYFTIRVSKKHPTIDILRGDELCRSISLSEVKTEKEKIIYLGRSICDI
ncbi:CS1-pili formation C-terminal domain-containing protein [Vibrio mediterranei]|uniref:Pilus assembly protein C-terminal domain-containing protein n=1 Tax=Vibrio mediterranei TaxID=689 RepID=A0A3G4VLD4_9VIBR|nr:CS1-pili formation C-terminal domain-containing protein [Vibrio mediterranei]AYV25009.1 hypothetical protein ECB94_27205 [Vibrio mediterranei]MCG9790791.1 CS1-pili formation C-terminal domain-containing protein [Vibrio mediterranei]